MSEEERERETTPEPSDKATLWPTYLGDEGRAAAVQSLAASVVSWGTAPRT